MGSSDELGEHADAVDGEAAEPLAEVVAVGAEDEVFVAEEGHGDAEGLGGDGGDDDGEGGSGGEGSGRRGRRSRSRGDRPKTVFQTPTRR